MKEFPQTLQPVAMDSGSAIELNGADPNRPKLPFSVFDTAEPPSLWTELAATAKTAVSPLRDKSTSSAFQVFKGLFPILSWGRNYDFTSFRRDLLAGLTIASLGIPQSIGYANLAKLDPQYGLYTSVVPPLIYAVMGSSNELAIGPVAAISLLMFSMVQKVVDPSVDPAAYRKIVLTATFFAGLFQSAFGFLRLGFLVDFLSHAAIVGFMAGAAIVIGCQQLKGLLGISHFTNNTDVVSVAKAVWSAVHQPWYPDNFLLGCSFLIFIMITRLLGRRNRKLFWLAAIAPLISVVMSTLLVFSTKADRHGVKIIQHVKGGLNKSSASELLFVGPYVGKSVKIGLICAVVALAEAIAAGQSFAAIRGYQLDGNKEMVAMGFMNIAGSISSCYVATGSFSRSAVNFTAGCKTPISNVVMAITVLVSLEFFTRLLYYTPYAILAAIIISALPNLIDVREAYNIWTVDKMDFLACIGAFLGVLFGSVEIGLMAALVISFASIILNSIRSRIEMLGRIPGTDTFCSTRLHPMVSRTPSILITRIDCSFFCFTNANFIRDRITKQALEVEKSMEEKRNEKIHSIEEKLNEKIHSLVIDMSNVMNIDTSGIAALGEIQKKMASVGIQVALANPGRRVLHKMKLSKLVEIIGRQWIFLTTSEAVEACLAFKKDVANAC